jgi:hypothetical protein
MVNPRAFRSPWQLFFLLSLQECSSDWCRWKPDCATYCPALRWSHANRGQCILFSNQNKTANFAHHSGGLEWVSLAQRTKIVRMCVLYKAYAGESYVSRVGHYWKIRARKQRTDIGKYSFVNRTITDWNKLPEGAIGTFQVKRIFSKRGLWKCKTVTGSRGDKK